MNATQQKPVLVEKSYSPSQYDNQCTLAIIDHPKHGRILITDGFGGQDGIRGGMMRWEHGLVVLLQPGDTFESLGGDWNDTTSHMQAILHGYDNERPVQEWDGAVVRSIAASVGL